MDDLHLLPKVRDALSYLYAEHARVDRHEKSIAIHDAHGGHTPVPAASLCVLMLGPGTTITHAAVQALADNNCLVVWCGEENVRFYAAGTGGTRGAAPLLHQARLASHMGRRLQVVRRMYAMRFGETPAPGDTVELWRGREGVRMREAYAKAARETGVAWSGRSYDRGSWGSADPVNRALSCANSCLYGLCHAAILATGYSPGIGFIHTGKQLSFVYDVADLYKVEVSIPVAFRVAAEDPPNLERAVRLACRDRFRETRLLSRIVPDIQKALDVSKEMAEEWWEGFAPDAGDPALPTELWTPSPEGETEGEPDDADEPVAGPPADADAAVTAASPPPAPAAEAPRAGPPAAASAPEFDDGPFGPDPGCEMPPPRFRDAANAPARPRGEGGR